MQHFGFLNRSISSQPLAARLRHTALFDRLMSAKAAATLIQDGMTLAMSGFTRAGEAKAVPLALLERAKRDNIGVHLMTGASLGNHLDGRLAAAGVTRRRLPFQADPALRKQINAGEVLYLDQHLSKTAEMLRAGHLPRPDIAIVEAVAITEDGGIVPTSSVGNSASFLAEARQVIVELNMTLPLAFEGLHDIYTPAARPGRMPIPLIEPQGRIGCTAINVPIERIAAIVLSDHRDSHATLAAPDADTIAIAEHLMEFFGSECRRGLLSPRLLPLQAGIGAVANAVLSGFAHGPFHDLTMYSEVLQDSAFDLMDAGKMTFASASSLALSEYRFTDLVSRLDAYRNKIILRPQEISNHPEIIRRLGIIAINTALEFDLYGNVNSTHVGGTAMMNGIGGSGDFARNAHLSIFVTPSRAKGGRISCVVPMVGHVDHTEHDVDIVVTEQGLADLRGLAPRERPARIIENCAHPDVRDALRDYFKRACSKGGQTPHLLDEALRWVGAGATA